MRQFAVWILFLLAAGEGSAVTVRFLPASPDVGPFPTDFLTVPDPAQKTGLRVNLPAAPFADLNKLDGFNLQPRLSVRFSGQVDVDTLRLGIYLVALENLTNDEYGLQRDGQVTPVNQLIYDPVTHTVYAKPDVFLDQHRRHMLVVTDAIRTPAGALVEADPAFAACLAAPPNAYCTSLSQAVARVSASFSPRRIVAASVFTTLSATHWMEQARRAVEQTPRALQPAGQRHVFPLAQVTSLTLRRHMGANPDRFEDFDFPLPGLFLDGVRSLAFLSYSSPVFLDDSQTIPFLPTGAGVPVPAAAARIGFHVFLPAAEKPRTGYPVMIFGHGLNDSRMGAPTLIAGTLAREGFAVVAINAVGHGNGPLSQLRIVETSLRTTELPVPGRGVDMNRDGVYGSSEGCLLMGSTPVALRDCLRQTALDLMQLVRVLRAGVDADGDGTVDLDGNRIYYAGQSLGALYGTVFTSVEPHVRASALNVGGASVTDIARWSPGFRSKARSMLASINPGLLNRGNDFDENYVLRYLPVKVNNVPGAIELQHFFELLEWLQVAGDPAAYAPHLKSSTLPDVPIKPVLWQVAKGDRTVPNPASTHLIRAANTRESTLFYRHDLARQVVPELDNNPHAYLVDITSPASVLVALRTQQQIADFFKSDGATLPSPEDPFIRLLFRRDLYEVPGFLTESLNY